MDKTDECYCDECNAARCNYSAWSRIWKQAAKNKKAESDRRLVLLKRCKERIETDLNSRGSFHRNHYKKLLDELAKELADD